MISCCSHTKSLTFYHIRYEWTLQLSNSWDPKGTDKWPKKTRTKKGDLNLQNMLRVFPILNPYFLPLNFHQIKVTDYPSNGNAQCLGKPRKSLYHFPELLWQPLFLGSPSQQNDQSTLSWKIPQLSLSLQEKKLTISIEVDKKVPICIKKLMDENFMHRKGMFLKWITESIKLLAKNEHLGAG